MHTEKVLKPCCDCSQSSQETMLLAWNLLLLPDKCEGTAAEKQVEGRS